MPKYVNNTHLSARVGQLNPAWNEDQSAEALDARFEEASQLTGREFSESLHWLSKVSLPDQHQYAIHLTVLRRWRPPVRFGFRHVLSCGRPLRRDWTWMPAAK